MKKISLAFLLSATLLFASNTIELPVESNLDKNSIYSMNLQYLVILIFFF